MSEMIMPKLKCPVCDTEMITIKYGSKLLDRYETIAGETRFSNQVLFISCVCPKCQCHVEYQGNEKRLEPK